MPQALLIGLTVAGVGLGAAGAVKQYGASKDMRDAQNQEIQQQQAIEAQKKQQMELEAQRKNLEILRQSQRARAVAISNATGDNATFGSGLQGGYGQISGAATTQLDSQDQNLAIGRNIFGIDAQMSQSRIAYTNAQSDAQTGATLSSLGGSLVSNAKGISAIGGQIPGFAGNFLPPTGWNSPWK